MCVLFNKQTEPLAFHSSIILYNVSSYDYHVILFYSTIHFAINVDKLQLYVLCTYICYYS